MTTYSVNRTSTALSTTNDYLTIIGASNRTVRLVAISISGGVTAGAYNEVVIARSTGGTTGGGAITPIPLISGSAAAAMTVNTTWSAQPTLGTTFVARIGLNANGGIYMKWFPPGFQPELRSTEQWSIRSVSGTSAVQMDLIVEEL